VIRLGGKYPQRTADNSRLASTVSHQYGGHSRMAAMKHYGTTRLVGEALESPGARELEQHLLAAHPRVKPLSHGVNNRAAQLVIV
jgi:hypothetical protein